MSEVLIAGELEPFLRQETVPADLSVRLLAADAEIPAGDYCGILPVLTRRITEPDLERAPRLRVIANYGAGHDNVDVVAARRRGIAVSNTPDVLTEATAELTWALILATARRLGEGERLVRAGEWHGWAPRQLLGMSLAGKTLGIVGAGRIGSEVARRAGAFGMRVAYWSRSRAAGLERDGRALFLELHELLASCDVVSVHLALTPATEGLLDAQAIARMKPHAILINTSRGRIIDEAALAAALERGAIRGAGLDVYSNEPTVPSRLLQLDNVVLLPHLGSATEEARMGMWRLAWQNLLRGVRGEPLLNPI
ncbi:MAG: 2-hydroxyacid dehydrogenase [Longimicrobiales bacterium]